MTSADEIEEVAVAVRATMFRLYDEVVDMADAYAIANAAIRTIERMRHELGWLTN